MQPVFSLQTPAPPHPLPASLPIPQPHLVPHHGGLTHQTYGHNQASSSSSHKQLSLGHLLGPRQEQCALPSENKAWDKLAQALEVDSRLAGQGIHGPWVTGIPSRSRGIASQWAIPLSPFQLLGQ